LERQKAELMAKLIEVPHDVQAILPSTSQAYSKKVERLTEALNRAEDRAEIAEANRGLIEKIVLRPGPDRGEIETMLYGELGTILNWIERQAIGKVTKKNAPAAFTTGVSARSGHSPTECYRIFTCGASAHGTTASRDSLSTASQVGFATGTRARFPGTRIAHTLESYGLRMTILMAVSILSR
jgi:hypothetical protein